MSERLFNKDVRKSCSWCVYGKSSEYTNEVFCKKHGVTTENDTCRKYKYDPLKRKPEAQKITGEFTQKDFSL